MADSNITKATIEMAKAALKQPLAKDATTQGFTTGLGIAGYELEAPAKSLFPVLSPFRNRIPRVKAKMGATAAHWKAIMAINATNQRATIGFGYAGNTIATKEQDFLAPFKLISLGDTVQLDAQIQAQEYQDLRATSGMNALYALMIQEDILDLGGQAFGLGAPGVATLTPASSGGSIGAVNVSVVAAARTMQGWFDGQSTSPSTAATTGVLTGTTNSVAATVASVPGAVCYDWYVGLAGGNMYYYTTTTSNKVTITSVPVAVSAIPTGPIFAQLSAPGYWTQTGNNPPVWTAVAKSVDILQDNSADANAYNGLIATLTGDFQNGGGYVQRGTGNPVGSYYKSLNGSAFTGVNGTIQEVDDALASLWATAKLSPTSILCNANDHINMSNKMISSGGAYTLFKPDNVGERQAVIGGQLVETYINKAVNGQAIPMETHPWLPQGTVILLTEKLPYPNNKVANVLEIETQQEYQQLEYATSRIPGAANGGPRYDFEVRAQQAFKNYFPGGMAIIQNIANA